MSGRQPEGSSTATLSGARDHARSQAEGARHVAPNEWTETLPSGGYTSRVITRGRVLRIDDIDGDACLNLIVYNAARTSERLNVADTVKVQWQCYLDQHSLLLSDMGRALMTLVADTSGRHDALCGASTRKRNEARYGHAGIHDRHPSGRDLLALGAAKHGLTRRDLPPSLNLFKSVRVAGDGSLQFDGVARPGCHVELRADMDVLVLMANTPHPLDPRATYKATAVELSVAGAPIATPDMSASADDPALTPERVRAYENTADYLGETLR